MARSNQIQEGFNWAESIKEHGLDMTILWRTWFHNGMSSKDLSENIGLSEKTCQKHLDRLTLEGKLFWSDAYRYFKVINPEKYKFSDLE